MPPAIAWILLGAALAYADDWPRFRGPNGSGVSQSTGLPVEFGPDKNLLWKTDVPPGHSSPVIAGSRLFITAYENDMLNVLCLDRDTGRKLWQREVQRSRKQPHNRYNGPATPTPATDGRRVYAFFPDAGVVAYTLGGKFEWMRDLGPFANHHGMASSPVTAGGLLLLLCDQERGSFLIALDSETGRTRWRTERDVNGPSYTTPVLLDGTVVVSGSGETAAYELVDGALRWKLDGLPPRPNVSPVVTSGGAIIIAQAQPYLEAHGKMPTYDQDLAQSDSNRDGLLSRAELSKVSLNVFLRADINGDGLIDRSEHERYAGEMAVRPALLAYRPSPDADETSPTLWRHERHAPNIASPLVCNGIVYALRTGGVLTALDAQNGAVLKQGRVGGLPGDILASPVAADGKLFLPNRAGIVAVVHASPDWEVLSLNDLGEEIYATPAIANGKLFVRTVRALYCFSNGGASKK